MPPGPTPPYGFAGAFDSFGALTLTWKSRQPDGAVGTTFQVSRRLNNSGRYEILDTVGTREFVDTTLPVGTHSVAYVVVAKRGAKTSTPAGFTMRFGQGGGGGGW
ncbi:MAG: hypothetical protein IPK69_08090 [Phycisphaerales bacterium]|nr:MAG: hypothetical protein IPK69_08090 [Phycisphaerales bacterium]